MTTGDYLRDVARGRGELEALTGVPVRWFRPPHGFLTAAILARLAMARHEVVLWSVDPKDYAAPDVEAVVDHLTRSTLTPRDIVLLHDTSRATADALPRLTAIVAEQAGASR
jgi:peptidoglycan/xylan/chitin deacetylase (PgdA/CDA1 family)